MLTKLSTKGQIVIPHKLRDEMQLDAGSLFEIQRKGNQIILTLHTEVSPVDLLYGMFAGEGMLDDLEAEHAGEVEKDWS